MSRELLTHPDWDKRDTSSLQGMGGGGAPLQPDLVEKIDRVADDGRARPPATASPRPTASSPPTRRASTSPSRRRAGRSCRRSTPSWSTRTATTCRPDPTTVGQLCVRGAGRDQGLPQPAGGHRRRDPRRLVQHRRHRPHRRGRLRLHRRPGQGHGAARRRERLLLARSRRRSTSTTTSPRRPCSACPTSASARRSPRSSCSRAGAALDADELRDFLDGRIAKHKIPATVWFRDEPLPRNANGKFLKRELRAELLGEPPSGRESVLGGFLPGIRHEILLRMRIPPRLGSYASSVGVFDVVAELGADGVDAVELALAAQEVLEADLGLLAVEVAVEVEQVRLEQRVVGVLVERRPPAEVDRARVDARRRAARTGRRRRRRPAGTPSWAPRRWRSGSRSGGRAGRPRRRCRAPRGAGRACAAASSTSPPASARRMAVQLIGSSIAVGARRRGRRDRRRSRAATPNSSSRRRCRRGGCRSGSPGRRRRPRRASASTSTRSMNDSGVSSACASSKRSTTVASSPVAASSSRRWSGESAAAAPTRGARPSPGAGRT